MNNLHIYKDLSNEDYHSKKDYISSSFVKSVFKHSVADALKPLEVSDALIEGDQFHTLMESELDFNKRFFVAEKPDDTAIIKEILTTPKKDGTFYTERGVTMTNKYKAWVAEHTPIVPEGKMLVWSDKFEQYNRMKESLLSNPMYLDRTKNTDQFNAEWSFFTKKNHVITFYDSHLYEYADEFGEIIVLDFSEFSDLKFRVRPDQFQMRGDEIIWIDDWKTCRDASLYAFKGDLYKLAYDLQAIFYSGVMGVDPELFTFWAVQKEKPYSSAPYNLKPDTIHRAIIKLHKTLKRIKLWKETGYDGLQESLQENLI